MDPISVNFAVTATILLQTQKTVALNYCDTAVANYVSYTNALDTLTSNDPSTENFSCTENIYICWGKYKPKCLPILKRYHSDYLRYKCQARAPE